MQRYSELPEFVRDDLLEGILVGGGVAIPVAMMANQDPSEQAAAVLGGIGAATLGGAASKHIGAALGRRLHPGAYEQGGFPANFGRVMGRENAVQDLMSDMFGQAPAPVITGEHFGRALGRAIGDEAFGVAGTIGALAAAQALDSTPDPQPQPTVNEVVMGTVPGAVLGTLASGLAGGLVDLPGLQRSIEAGDTGLEALRRNSVFRRREP